jgi:uncharacterized protein YdaU (DUF1376 family)
MPGFMMDVQRLFASELWAISNGDEFKAAMALWGRAWQQTPAGSLPNDDRLLAAFSGAGSRWKKVRTVALRGFVECSDGRLYHKTLCEDVNAAWAKRLKFRERTAAATAARSARNDQRNVERSDNVTFTQRQGTVDSRHIETSSSSNPMPEKNDDDEFSGIESSKKRCEEAAGRCLGRFDVIELLLQEGVNLETCVLPAIREVVANQRKRGLPAPVTWCYFDAEIRNRDALNRRDVAAVSSRKFVVYETPEYQNISKRNPSFWKTRLENVDGKTGVWFYGEPSVDCEVRA